MKLFRSSLFFLLVFATSLSSGGFIAGTLVKTSTGNVPIEKIITDTSVISCSGKSDQIIQCICAIKKSTTQELIGLSVAGEEIIAQEDQLFYLPLEQKWRRVVDLHSGDFLMSLSGFAQVTRISKLDISAQVYDLHVQKTHNFYVSRLGLLTHNFVITIPILTWGAGEIVFFGGVTLSTLAVSLGLITAGKTIEKATGTTIDLEIGLDGSYCGQSFIDENVQSVKNKIQSKNRVSSCGDPEDPDNHANFIYCSPNAPDSDNNNFQKKPLSIRKKEVEAYAKANGYKLTKDFDFNSKGQRVYKKGRKLITIDLDSHKGGDLKVFYIDTRTRETIKFDGTVIGD